jgi:hypothetical protein
VDREGQISTDLPLLIGIKDFNVAIRSSNRDSFGKIS